jgi:hypothetical protein
MIGSKLWDVNAPILGTGEALAAKLEAITQKIPAPMLRPYDAPQP